MKKRRYLLTAISIILCLFFAVNTFSCGKNPKASETKNPSSSVTGPSAPSTSGDVTDKPQNTQKPVETTPSVSPSPSPPPYPGPEVKLVPYDGIVEHIFFHEVIAYPELAFDGDAEQQGFDEYMVTVSEYNKVLDELYWNGFILVNLNDVWSEYIDESGVHKMRKNTLMLPENKKPLIISYDDISFYKYMQGNGFMQKLIIGDDGDIWATGVDRSGAPIITQDLTAVTILDKFVRQHPDFSMNGVKGCIALTGYEGILGYRTQTDRNNDTEEFRANRMQEIARVRPVVERLKETGWYFASHSYGHIGLAGASFNGVSADATRWMDEVGSLVGPTKIFLYPFGSRLDGNDVYDTGPALKYYHDLGFRYFGSVGYESFSRIKPDIAAVVFDRINIDGITLRSEKSRERFLQYGFFDSAQILDPMRP